MSSKNDESNALAFAAAFIFAGMIFLAFAIFAVAAFITFVLTIICVIACFRPLKLGNETIYPEQASAFIVRGCAGSIILPAFALFASALFKFQIVPDYWPYIFLLGYIGGSLGIEMLNAEDDGNAGRSAPPLPPSPPQQSLPRPEPEPFRYASWDDEEEARK